MVSGVPGAVLLHLIEKMKRDLSNSWLLYEESVRFAIACAHEEVLNPSPPQMGWGVTSGDSRDAKTAEQKVRAT